MATEYKLSYTGSQINEKLGKIDSLAEKSELPTTFYVNVQFDSDTGTYVADSTPGEIGGAYHSGKPVYCHLVTQDFSCLLSLQDEIVTNTVYRFGGADSTRGILVAIMPSSVDVFVHEFSETLPNPHKLTLTGAVSAEYDGSKAVSVEIPESFSGSWNDLTDKPNEADAVELIAEMGFAEPIAADDGSIFTDENGNVYTLI